MFQWLVLQGLVLLSPGRVRLLIVKDTTPGRWNGGGYNYPRLITVCCEEPLLISVAPGAPGRKECLFVFSRQSRADYEKLDTLHSSVNGIWSCFCTFPGSRPHSSLVCRMCVWTMSWRLRSAVISLAEKTTHTHTQPLTLISMCIVVKYTL